MRLNELKSTAEAMADVNAELKMQENAEEIM